MLAKFYLCFSALWLLAAASGTSYNITIVANERPALAHIPSSYKYPSKVAVLVLIHGIWEEGAEIIEKFKLKSAASDKGVILISPDGRRDNSGQRFWNSPDTCCDFYGSGVDDGEYLIGLVDELAKNPSINVDMDRIYFAGSSNGGFMALDMACRFSNRVAAVFDLGGAMNEDRCRCEATSPVSVLHLHGINDAWILFNGGKLMSPYTSAADTVLRWAQMDGCDTTKIAGPPLSLISQEVTSESFANCPEGVDVASWTFDGPHVPALPDDFGDILLAWFLAHPKVRGQTMTLCPKPSDPVHYKPWPVMTCYIGSNSAGSVSAMDTATAALYSKMELNGCARAKVSCGMAKACPSDEDPNGLACAIGNIVMGLGMAVGAGGALCPPGAADDTLTEVYFPYNMEFCPTEQVVQMRYAAPLLHNLECCVDSNCNLPTNKLPVQCFAPPCDVYTLKACPAGPAESCCTRVMPRADATVAMQLPAGRSLASLALWREAAAGGGPRGLLPLGAPAPGDLQVEVTQGGRGYGCLLANAFPPAQAPQPGMAGWPLLCGLDAPAANGQQTIRLSLGPALAAALAPGDRVAVRVCSRVAPPGTALPSGALWILTGPGP